MALLPQLASGTVDSVSPDNNKAGERALYTINFTTTDTLPPDGKIVVTFSSSGFDLSGVSIASSISINGGLFIENTTSTTVTITRDNTGDATPPGSLDIHFANVVNHTTAGSYSVTVETRKSDNTLIENVGSKLFSIVANDLDHFNISTISSPQTAGVPFSITITAMDANDNTVTSFTGTANLSDVTGTISPTLTGNFTDGVWTGELTITKSISGDMITVTSSGKAGTSNSFNVVAGPLDHFIVAADTNGTLISSQTAGQSFNLGIVAKDQYENTVRSFSGTLTLSDDTGTLTPSTANMSGGVWQGNVTITKAQDDIRIRVSGGGKISYSNYFNINPAPVASLIIRDAAGGMGNEVGEVVMTLDDKLILYAAGYDQYGNYTHDVIANWSVSSGNLDPPDPLTGTSTTFDPVTPGTSGKIRADSAGIADETGTITVGTVSYVLIRTAPNGAGIELGDTTLTADDSITLYAAGYDAGGNFIGDVVVDWRSTGTLAPPILNSGATGITFNPTTAPATGRIIADHPSATDDTTGTITVGPGKPVGEITLTPTPSIINANGTDTSRVTSSPIRDSDGNPAQGYLMLVNISPPGIATIISPPDADPGKPGHQVTVDTTGQIAFTLQAGTIGGVATLTVSSIDGGSAYGDTTLTLMSLNILSINAIPTTVSRGQPQAQVNMRVENLGGETVTIQTANLTFSGPDPGYPYDGDYIVQWTENVTSIPPGATETLIFQVEVGSLAALDTVTIDGEITGVVDGTVVSDTGAETKDSWLVQIPARLRILKITTPVDTLTRGQRNVSVSMTVKNTGQATALIATDSLTFWSEGTPVVSDYQIFPRLSNPDSILGGQQAQFNFSVTVSNTATLGEITINGFINGQDANSLVSIEDSSADTTASWFVKEAPIVGILSFQPSQETVTSGQRKPWYLRMEVRNAGGTAVRLDSALVRFFIRGTDRTGEYNITYPSTFLGSGTAVLDTGNVDSLKFTIQKTGTSLGQATVQGYIYLTDIGTQNPITDQKATGVTIQSPAQLSIESVTPSQSQVTRGQGQDWTVDVVVKNSGESSLTIDTSQTSITLSTGEDFLVSGPTTPGGLILEGNSTKSLIFVVDSTGWTTGTCYISVTVGGIQNNDDSLMVAQADSAASVKVEKPADIRILDVSALLSTAPNAPYVNTAREVKIRVIVENNGEDSARDVKVLLTSDGASSIRDTVQTIYHVSGNGLTGSTSFNITTPAVPDTETFTATIISARAYNTDEPLGIAFSPAVDSTDTLIIERPAGFYIVNVIPSQDTIIAEQTTPWEIYVVVQDTGDAEFELNPPSSTDISIWIGGQVQTDYDIDPPDTLKGGGLILEGGAFPDTLVYTVTRTGRVGGEAIVRAHLSGKDKNDNKTYSDTEDTTITVKTSAVVRILRTVPLCKNMASEDIGLVNTGQDFEILVQVKNEGRERVDSVAVTLTSDGTSSFPDTVWINSLSVNEAKTLSFGVIADSVENLAGERFTSRIVSATAHLSGLPAPIGEALDSTAVVRIQRPAQLELVSQISDEDRKLSTHQSFTLWATVINRGRAGVDNSGRVTLFLPTNYRILPDTSSGPDTLSFIVGEAVQWNILSPDTTSGPDSIIVRITNIPKDLNFDSTASVLNQADTVIVWTFGSEVGIAKTEIVAPPGAADDTLSTGQRFQVQSAIFASENIVSLEATLTLPQGYSPISSLTQQVFNDTARWWVRAPASPDPSIQWLIINVTGRDEGGNIFYGDHPDSLAIITVKKAILNLSILSPRGGDIVLSRGQPFVIRAVVENTGKAHVYGPAYLRMDLGTSGVTTSEPLVKPFEAGVPVDWRAVAPDSITPPANIRVSIDTIPFDENTNWTAEVSKGWDQFSVSTVERGRILIDSLFVWDPPGATDLVLSTDQVFNVKAEITSENCRDLTAEIILPPGYDTEEWTKDVTTPTGTVSWRVTAPAEANPIQPIIVVTHGYDAHNDTLKLPESSDTLWVTVVKKATLQVEAKITDPPEASDGILSTNQVFTITGSVINTGIAGVQGEAILNISLPEGYIIQEDTFKTTQDLQARWLVKAPGVSPGVPSDIIIRMKGVPKDVNTNKTAYVSSYFDKITVTTQVNRLQVSVVSRGSRTVAKGDTSVLAVRLRFENLGGRGSNAIRIKALVLRLTDKEAEELIPNKCISRLLAVNSSDYSILYGEVAQMPGANPIDLNFSYQPLVTPGGLVSIDLLVDVSPQASITNFRVVIEDVQAKDAVSDLSPVKVVDETGSELIEIKADLCVVLEPDLPKAFGSYPNPFGSPGKEKTHFVYYLKQDADVEIKIYTLLGELVWSRSFKATDLQGRAGMHDGDVIWDGTNDQGYKVLNGVYIARLKTSYGEVAITKIAVIK